MLGLNKFNRSLATTIQRLGVAILIAILILMAPISGVQAQEIPREANRELTDFEKLELTDFAIKQLEDIQSLSIRDNVEYCGLLGYKASGELSATPPERGGEESCALPEKHEGIQEVLASYHTHGGHIYDDSGIELPSLADLKGDICDKTYGYISTPRGRVWFNDFKTGKAHLLCGPLLNCVGHDPKSKEDEDLYLQDIYTLESLTKFFSDGSHGFEGPGKDDCPELKRLIGISV